MSHLLVQSYSPLSDGSVAPSNVVNSGGYLATDVRLQVNHTGNVQDLPNVKVSYFLSTDSQLKVSDDKLVRNKCASVITHGIYV